MRYVKELSLLFIAALISGCITSSPERASKVIFDMGHGEIFSPNDESPSSYTGLYYQFYAKGFETEVTYHPLTASVISEANALVLAGPMKQFSSQEISEIKNFVRDGGDLLILVHIFNPVIALANEFGIAVTGNITDEAVNLINASSQDFYIMDFEDHPITRDIKNVSAYGTWSLTAREPARIVAWTSGSAWQDALKNRIFDSNIEKRERLGIIAASEYGKGKVVVAADDAIFIERFMDEGDNRKLGENIVNWFKASRTVPNSIK